MSIIDKKNILVLMADQLRRDALGCYGNQIIKTPNLDKLAQGGACFTNAHCPTPICVPSRMSFITGQRASKHHWVTNDPLPGPIPELPTMMTLLNRAGYHTQGIGKMHFFGRMYGFHSLQRMEEAVEFRADDDYLLYLKEHKIRTRYPQGLRDLLYYQPQTSGIPEEHSQSRWVANQSVKFLRDHKKQRPGKPFFLWSSWIAPHPPFAPCEPYDQMYNPEDFSLPINAERPINSIPQCAHGHRSRLENAHLDSDRIRRIKALYAGQVTQVDDCIGQILDELNNLGLTDNTIILFLSDHGDMIGDQGLSQKNVPYAASVNIPMLLKWPGKVNPDFQCNDLVGVEDFLPTLIGELGLEYDSKVGELPGASLLGRDGGGLKNDRENYFTDFGDGENRWIAVTNKKYKYVFWACGGYEELYDLKKDPYEIKNIINAQPEISKKLRKLVLEWEDRWGVENSIIGNKLRICPAPIVENLLRNVNINEGRWPENLPEEELNSIETYAEAFTRAVSKEATLNPDKLSIDIYKKRGGHSLIGTPWKNRYKEA